MWLARPAGFEPTTPGLGILCSILLSYGRWKVIAFGGDRSAEVQRTEAGRRWPPMLEGDRCEPGGPFTPYFRSLDRFQTPLAGVGLAFKFSPPRPP